MLRVRDTVFLFVDPIELHLTENYQKTKLTKPKMLNERETTTFISFCKREDLFRLQHVKTTFKLPFSTLDIWFTQTQYSRITVSKVIVTRLFNTGGVVLRKASH